MTETSEFLLSEEYVQNCFHSYLKSALTQAKVERLLDNEVLASAESDLMITGPLLTILCYPGGSLLSYNRPCVMLVLCSTSLDYRATLGTLATPHKINCAAERALVQ